MKEDPVKDKRIVELNDIVEEVKESEEWEAVKMNILEIGIEKGIEQGLQQGLQQGVQQGAEKKLLEQVEKKLKKGQTIAQIADALEESEAKIREVRLVPGCLGIQNGYSVEIRKINISRDEKC